MGPQLLIDDRSRSILPVALEPTERRIDRVQLLVLIVIAPGNVVPTLLSALLTTPRAVARLKYSSA